MKKSKYRFKIPLRIQIGSKKISLNLNWYRNAHFYLNNQVKQVFAPLELEYFKANKIRIEYYLTISNNRKTDFMNWISIADKFFLDWLVTMNMIQDDNTEHYMGNTVTVCKNTTLKDHELIAYVIILE